MNKSMAKKIIGMFLGFVLVTVLGVGAYAYTIYQQSTQTLAKTYKKIGEETKVIEATEPLTILLMGVDTGNVERTDPWAGNSDSMILVWAWTQGMLNVQIHGRVIVIR